MKFRTTIILFMIFILLLAIVLFFEFRGKGEKNVEEKLVNLSSDDVQEITFKKQKETISFKKDEKGEWFITEPLEAKADNYEVNRLAEDFSSLKIERVVEEEPEELSSYDIPQREITLQYKSLDNPIRILIGMENPLDNTFFTKREDEQRIVLIPSHLKTILDKNVFDFRQKDIFKFETDEVKNIKLRAKDTRWEAAKKGDEWFFNAPVKALAEKDKITTILNSLSNLKAKDFLSEEKNKEEIKKYGFDKAEYEIILAMPVTNKEVTFSLHKEDENTYATTSLSPKIITVESTILSDLEKKAEELREKEVVNFHTWEASKLHLKREKLDIKVLKGKDDTWHFESSENDEADGNKIRDFIRKIESLQAVEFIDPPLSLKNFGLDNPQAEITIWTKEEDAEKGKEF
ncbi:MAG: DUF4340 domain-containing protein, partial [Candidatus Aminicenantaceae bacterium]